MVTRRVTSRVTAPTARRVTGDGVSAGSEATPLLLDTYTGAAAAYSLRKLRNAYSGLAIRVRRSSDSAEQDIGFASDGGLDTSALTTFSGAGNAFVTKWYDQSGNSRDATQATAASQPAIVASGAVITRGSMPAIKFDGTDDRLALGFNGFSAVVHLFFVVNQNSEQSNGFQRFIYLADGAGKSFTIARSSFNVPTSSGNDFETLTKNTDNEAGTDSLKWGKFIEQAVFSTLSNGASSTDFYVNSSSKSSVSGPDLGAGNGVGSFIGVRDDLVASTHSSAAFQEIVLYHSTQASNRAAIETNILSYYGLP